ncbi:hypothetical protein OUZ56_031747 [Daphnia magna]|uniref:Uncharacterized protein n=1 Tax=Daphnia magna TaxID=35525 RepID=A0ABQ9ZV72_9CRUS|nr:hypothetical protein OUZ56_031747 [Daphnia magna]
MEKKKKDERKGPIINETSSSNSGKERTTIKPNPTPPADRLGPIIILLANGIDRLLMIAHTATLKKRSGSKGSQFTSGT